MATEYKIQENIGDIEVCTDFKMLEVKVGEFSGKARHERRSRFR